MRKFAQILTKYVEASGMKQTRVASIASISYNYLQRLLSGDRNPSEQVVYKLSEALHLSVEQTGELLAAAGYAPPMNLLQPVPVREQSSIIPSASLKEKNPATIITQQLYLLTQEIPETLQAPFSIPSQKRKIIKKQKRYRNLQKHLRICFQQLIV